MNYYSKFYATATANLFVLSVNVQFYLIIRNNIMYDSANQDKKLYSFAFIYCKENINSYEVRYKKNCVRRYLRTYVRSYTSLGVNMKNDIVTRSNFLNMREKLENRNKILYIKVI